jgi:hypothetical protein
MNPRAASLDRDQADTELVKTLRRIGGSYQPFTPGTAAAEFPFRSRAWVSARLREATDGSRPLPGVTLLRHPRQPIYSLLPDGGWPAT